MARKSKYGNMPAQPEYVATVKGDAGTYNVWGFDWMNHRVLLDRASSLEWTPISKVSLTLKSEAVPLPCEPGGRKVLTFNPTEATSAGSARFEVSSLLQWEGSQPVTDVMTEPTSLDIKKTE